jgi:ABC-type multidrug transport system fused ATPase/permease subunit
MELANVSYIYENNNHPAVKDVSLAISVYEKIGFFGPSGSGKTTVAKLLLNRISPTDGNIYINGEHLEDLDIESLHRVLTIVPQQLELFQGTLHYNLTFGPRQALEEEINHILSLTSLESVVSALPKGLHSDVGDFCKDFSGGERQRIGIAMALLRRPQFIILDEALSFVDKESAHKIINGLRDLPFLKGFILISHDLSLLSSLDKIVFFKNGEVQTITAPATLIPEKTMKVS